MHSRFGWAGDHHHRQAKDARCLNLRARAGSTRVACHDDICAMVAQKREVAGKVERAFRHFDAAKRQWRRVRRVHQPQKIMVLRARGEGRQMLLSYGKEYARRRARQGGGGLGLIRDGFPAISRLRYPWRAGQAQMGDACGLRGCAGIRADARRERVSCIDQMGKPAGHKIAGQPLDTAETAHAVFNRLRSGLQGAPGIGIDGIQTPRSQFAGQSGGLGRAAKKKDAHGNQPLAFNHRHR